jgi:hypothetical protein
VIFSISRVASLLGRPSLKLEHDFGQNSPIHLIARALIDRKLAAELDGGLDVAN